MGRKRRREPEEEEVKDAPVPTEGETIGIVEELLGAYKLRVTCLDGKTRLCRIPGRLRRRVWIKRGDIVLVAPWEFQEERGDVIYRYSQAEVRFLRRKGVIPPDFGVE